MAARISIGIASGSSALSSARNVVVWRRAPSIAKHHQKRRINQQAGHYGGSATLCSAGAIARIA